MKFKDILKEIKTRQKTLLGSGDEQVVYPYEKNPNFVIKKQLHPSERNLDAYIKIQKKYPEYVAQVIKPKGSYKGYYFQEKLDNKRFMDDMVKITANVHNKLLTILSKKYKTPDEAHENFSGITDGSSKLNFNGSDLGGFEAGDLSLSGHHWGDLYGEEDWDSVIQDLRVDDDIFSVYEYYEHLLNIFKKGTTFYELGKDTPIIQKLQPLFEIPKRFGEFHEGNVGYDKNNNLKILDL